MDSAALECCLLEALQLPRTQVCAGVSNAIACNKEYRALFRHRKVPERGWSDLQIERLLLTLSSVDTNHDRPLSLPADDDDDDGRRWCGVGEREGRVYSSLLVRRHFGFAHGVGRSGDICEVQPKAVGSSALFRLTNDLALDAIQRAAGLDAKECIVLPLCTGMAISLVLSSLRPADGRNIVLWSRVDQKACLKAVLANAHLTCIVLPTAILHDKVTTDIRAIRRALQTYDGRVLALISVTSCFAPRIPDQIDDIAKLCQQYHVAHVVNNAYGLQCANICKLINRASVVGRVDAVVSSTDKNFLVPVGGAIVTSPSAQVIKNISQIYPGRASIAPILDLFITLLSMGLNNYKTLLANRRRLANVLRDGLKVVAERHGERLLDCHEENSISFGITLDNLLHDSPVTCHPKDVAATTYEIAPVGIDNGDDNHAEHEASDANLTSIASVPIKTHDENVTAAGVTTTIPLLTELSKEQQEAISYFGSMLFTRCVSGTRVVPRGQTKLISGHFFLGFGSSTDHYPHSYLTAACAIGVSHGEITEFLKRLDKCFLDYKKKRRNKENDTKRPEQTADDSTQDETIVPSINEAFASFHA